jgi:hypothetical protein
MSASSHGKAIFLSEYQRLSSVTASYMEGPRMGYTKESMRISMIQDLHRVIK